MIVSESMARKLWPGGRAVGETIRIEQDFGAGPAPTQEPTLPTRVVTVVGVSRDVTGFRITDVKQPDVFLPTSVNAPNTSIAARVNGDPTLARGTLIDHLTRVDPNMGAIVTMRTMAGLETFFLQVAFCVALVLGGLALLLTVSGLFSVLSYLVEQRTREIGVRMALGASSGRVAQLILADDEPRFEWVAGRSWTRRVTGHHPARDAGRGNDWPGRARHRPGWRMAGACC